MPERAPHLILGLVVEYLEGVPMDRLAERIHGSKEDVAFLLLSHAEAVVMSLHHEGYAISPDDALRRAIASPSSLLRSGQIIH